MSVFKIITFPNANPNEAIVEYQKAIVSILSTLNHHLRSLESYDGIQQELDELIKNARKGEGIFDPFRINIQYHPRLWAKTSRTGASPIALLEEEQEVLGIKLKNGQKGKPKPDETTYEHLIKKLKTLKSTLHWRKDGSLKEHISNAIYELDELQKDAVSVYLARLRIETAKALMQRLDCKELDEQIKGSKNAEGLILKQVRLMWEIKDIEALTVDQLKTADDCLLYSEKVNKLRNDLIQFKTDLKKQKIDINDEIKENAKESKQEIVHDKTEENHQVKKKEAFEHLALQLSIVTKREIDPHYDNPKELNSKDKFRKKLKIVTTAIGGVFGVAAFVCLCIPGAQLFSFVLGPIGIVALSPLIDTAIEVGRHFWHGRSPTKAQVAELGFWIPFIATLNFAAHALAPIGIAIAGKASALAKTMAKISLFIANKFMNIFGGVVNSLGSIGNTLGLKAATQAKTEKMAAHQKATSFKTAITLIHDQEKTLKHKSDATTSEARLKAKLKEKNEKEIYLLRVKNRDEEIVDSIPSYASKIAAFRGGFFSDTNTIQHAVNTYAGLSSNSSLQSRIAALKLIENRIHDWNDDHKKDVPQETKAAIDEFTSWVEQEKVNLKQYETIGKDDIDDQKHQRIYLVNRKK